MQVVPSKSKNVVKTCGLVFLCNALTKALRVAAVWRSLTFVFTVALPRPIVITTGQISALGPVPVTRILPPQSIEIVNVVEGRSVRPEALSADDNSGDQLG
ncbi:unnamed protein product [Macrosiphum euphorbiae]|uniref:Uncharacterized protein n=1 Tax=Macrosiphum euphorbiae TaxID=13131 RepID=A0AAV0Y1D6_9HEMI|nr:unnamed protein product [Macrosiphum euphorbiae]